MPEKTLEKKIRETLPLPPTDQMKLLINEVVRLTGELELINDRLDSIVVMIGKLKKEDQPKTVWK